MVPVGCANSRAEGSPFSSVLRTSSVVVLLLAASACSNDDPKVAITNILSDGSSGIARDDISFDGCEMRISSSGDLPDGGSQSVTLRADLSLFDLRETQIFSMREDAAVVLAGREPTDERLIDQAVRIVERLPDQFDSTPSQLTMSDGETIVREDRFAMNPGEGLPRERVTQILETPPRTLVFRLSSVAIGGEPLEPDENAPAFYEFAQRVQEIPAPQTALIGLQFNETKQRGDGLLAGSVSIPQVLQLQAGSDAKGEQLIEALNAYKQQNCHGG